MTEETKATVSPSVQDVANARASSRRGRCSWLKKLGLLLGGFVAACVLAEVGVLLFLGEQPKFPRHVVAAEWGLRINEPGAHYRHKSADVNVQFRINSRGLRSDSEYDYVKPADVKRIISLGDSYTAGYEVDVNDCFSSVLERTLNNSGQNVEVLNAGVSGFSTAEECLYFERELIKYDPDLVLISYYHNDLVDNVRTNLFQLDGDRLIESARSYVPAGRLGNFLNTNPLFNFFSERSNAFVVLKEKATLLLKRQAVAANEQNLRESTTNMKTNDADDYPRRLCSAIYERLYQICRNRNIPLIIHSIPIRAGNDLRDLADTFPAELFNMNRPGLFYLSAKNLLDPHRYDQKLYWLRSHYHFTPFAHDNVGIALSDLIVNQRLLDVTDDSITMKDSMIP